MRGITWNHSRGFPPLVATAQRFEELNPDVTIQAGRPLAAWLVGDMEMNRTIEEMNRIYRDSLSQSTGASRKV